MIAFGYNWTPGRPLSVGVAADPQALLLAAMDAGGGQNAFVIYENATGVGTTAYNLPDESANGNDHFQDVFGSRTPSATGDFDGSSYSIQNIAGGTMDIIFGFTKDAGSTIGFMATKGASTGIVSYNDGNTTPFVGFQVLVDGTPAANGDELHAALDDAAEHVVQILDIDLTGQTLVGVGRGGSSMVGTVRKAALIDQGNIADLAEARSNAVLAVVA